MIEYNKFDSLRFAFPFLEAYLEIFKTWTDITKKQGGKNLVNLNKFRDPKGKIAMSYGVTALPTTVVIDPFGKEIGRIIGDIDWDTADVRSFFKKLLENK